MWETGTVSSLTSSRVDWCHLFQYFPHESFCLVLRWLMFPFHWLGIFRSGLNFLHCYRDLCFASMASPCFHSLGIWKLGSHHLGLGNKNKQPCLYFRFASQWLSPGPRYNTPGWPWATGYIFHLARISICGGPIGPSPHTCKNRFEKSH